ncbi:MAG: hypothetical protein MSG64_03440 [Pyrinomonadaceae bacterium MAG19_C2-C3]|nr:hypothetical protein [Pyrinomonadaceae bacterium MAG19_C2-C3]
MKVIKFFLTMCVMVCVVGAMQVPNVHAQRRRGRATTRTTNRASTATNNATRLAAIETARTEVASQIKTLSRFLYLYGRVSKSLDDVTAEARATATEAAQSGVGTRGVTQAVERNRQQIRSNFAGVRAGVDALDARFIGIPELAAARGELTNARLAAQEAEALVGRDRYDDAGRRLLDAVASLTTILQQVK